MDFRIAIFFFFGELRIATPAILHEEVILKKPANKIFTI